MPEITPLRPEQTGEARRLIYTVAYEIFHDAPTLEETLALYQQRWPLRDIDDFQREYNEQGGAYLVMTEGGRVIGSGALRRLEPEVGEIKRLWFLPEYQGKGLGYRMMLALFEIARQQGYKILRLETSPAYQPRAYAFYRKLGFYDIPRYGDEDDDIGMELIL